jgi:hypothetical protein
MKQHEGGPFLSPAGVKNGKADDTTPPALSRTHQRSVNFAKGADYAEKFLARITRITRLNQKDGWEGFA